MNHAVCWRFDGSGHTHPKGDFIVVHQHSLCAFGVKPHIFVMHLVVNTQHFFKHEVRSWHGCVAF